MKRFLLMCAGTLLVVGLSACERAPTPAQNGVAAASARADTDAKKLLADVIAALNAKDWTSLKGFYSPDAVMITPETPPFRGAQAISAEYDRLAADPALQFKGTPGAIRVSSSGDVAYADATYKMRYTNPQTSKVDSANGYCIWVFSKQADGSWKIVRDVSSPLPAVD